MPWLVVHHMSSVHEVSDVLMAIAPLYPSRRHDRTGFHAGKKWGKKQINVFFENHDKNGTSVLLWMVTPVRAVRNAASTIQLANFQAGGCWVFLRHQSYQNNQNENQCPKSDTSIEWFENIDGRLVCQFFFPGLWALVLPGSEQSNLTFPHVIWVIRGWCIMPPYDDSVRTSSSERPPDNPFPARSLQFLCFGGQVSFHALQFLNVSCGLFVERGFQQWPSKTSSFAKEARKVQHIPICRYNHGADLFRLRPVWDDDTEWEAALQKAGALSYDTWWKHSPNVTPVVEILGPKTREQRK